MTAETTVKKPRRGGAKSVKKTGDTSAAPGSTPSKGSGQARSPQATPRPAAGGARTKKAESVHRLRIKVRAYEHGILDKSVKQIIDTAARYNAVVVGPVPLPIDIKKYTVNRAAFIDKDSREQFEMRIHKRMIDILNPAPKVIEALTNIDLPSGVSIDVKMM